MEFPARIGKGNQITIPRNFMQIDDLAVGDMVIVSVRKKDSVEHHKRTLEKTWSEKDATKGHTVVK